MPRKCSVCVHPKRDEIDQAIAGTEAYRSIAKHYHLSPSAVERHAKNHLPATLAEAQQASEVARADDLLDQVRTLKDKALGILETAEGAGKLGTALNGIREARGCIELLAKLIGKLDERPTVNILLSPQWVELRRTILVALQPYPEAKAALAEVLTDGS